MNDGSWHAATVSDRHNLNIYRKGVIVANLLVIYHQFKLFYLRTAMIRLTGLYKNMSDSEFDFDYYMNRHLPLVKKRLADFGMGEFEVERGIETPNGEAALYICIVHIEFPTIDDFKRGFEKHGEELYADVTNYTNITPEMQMSEIVKSLE